MSYIIVTVEGNISSGKSTVLNCLMNTNNNVIVVEEPIEEWQACKNVKGESKLKSFYLNSESEAFSFQHYAQMTRVVAMNNAIAEAIEKSKSCDSGPIFVLSERSIQSGNHIFGEHLVSQGFLSAKENLTIINLCDQLLVKPVFKERAIGSIVLNLQTSPDVCFERYKSRNRAGENLTLDYLKNLNDHSQKYFSSVDDSRKSYSNFINRGVEKICNIDASGDVDAVCKLVATELSCAIESVNLKWGAQLLRSLGCLSLNTDKAKILDRLSNLGLDHEWISDDNSDED